LVNDSIFSHNIAIFIHCQLPFDKVFTEVCVEWATSRGHVNLIKWMIQNAQFIDKSKEKGKRNDFQRGLTPTLKSRALIQSCLTGFEEVAKVLLQANADPHYDNNQAICMAAKYGHLECVKLLHQHGANIHVDEDYPLVFSARNGHYQIVSFLIENDANIHARRDCALHWA
jgi:ankyrin repeat protein